MVQAEQRCELEAGSCYRFRPWCIGHIVRRWQLVGDLVTAVLFDLTSDAVELATLSPRFSSTSSPRHLSPPGGGGASSLRFSVHIGAHGMEQKNGGGEKQALTFFGSRARRDKLLSGIRANADAAMGPLEDHCWPVTAGRETSAMWFSFPPRNLREGGMFFENCIASTLSLDFPHCGHRPR